MASEQTPPPPVSPYLTVHDAKGAVEFYKRAFGAVELARQPTPDGSKLIHAALSINGGLLMLSDDFPEMSGGRTPLKLGGSPVTIHLDLPNVDETWANAVAAGATVTMPLDNMFWGDRYGKLRDPYGHEWSLATRKGAVSKQQLDEGAEKYFPKKD